jgi:NAD(P)-dependent dehydrogenase (short-subunit alcohol dehydrogenase family)
MNSALIWGITGGIGQALARQLQSAGWNVLGIARDPSRSELDLPTYAANVGREADVAAAVHWAAMEAGSVQLWVYTTGEMLGKPLSDTTLNDWNALLEANITGAHLATTHSLPLVATGGHMVYLGAYVDRIMLPKIGAYTAGKAALDAYVQVLAKEVRDRRISLVRVGAVDTPLWDAAPFKLPKGAHSPDNVATAIITAHTNGHKGILEIGH